MHRNGVSSYTPSPFSTPLQPSLQLQCETPLPLPPVFDRRGTIPTLASSLEIMRSMTECGRRLPHAYTHTAIADPTGGHLAIRVSAL